MTATEIIPAMTERIVQRCDPLQIILFGSQARGDAGPRSDVDLLVIFPSVADLEQKTIEIAQELRAFPIPTDVVVTTPEEIRQRGNLVGTVLRPALREGRVLYSHSQTTIERGALPVSDDEVLAEARVWLQDAEEDLSTAILLSERIEVTPRQAGFFAQQAAEKALKAIYIFLQIDYPLSHNLDDLRNGLPGGWQVKTEYPLLSDLTGWAVQARYPTRRSSSGREGARLDVKQAQALIEALVRDLLAHGFKLEDK
ncbi:MAG: HEPN domain-containing protein [Dehalococcoidia bacterium]